MNDRFDSPPPSDFPTDPVAHHDILFWALVTVVLIVMASVLTVLFKEAERRASRGMGDSIEARAKSVMKKLSAGAKAGHDDQIQKAEDARAAVKENFGKTLELSAALTKVVGKLNSAIEGTKEEAYTGKGNGAPAHMTGGTVINIAVNGSGEPVAAAAGAAPAPVPDGAPASDKNVQMSPDEKSESVWKAMQKLFNYWKNLGAVTAAFRAAQQQLMASPRWEDPREDDPFKSRKS